MPLQIQNITSEAYQRHIVQYDPSEITLELRYASIVQSWIMNVEYRDWAIYGVKLSVGTLHIRQENQPFDFVVLDLSGLGLDPVSRNDFADGRCGLFMLTASEMEAIRGAPVP